MKKGYLEPLVLVGALAILSTLVVLEGRRRVDLERQLPVEPRDVYRTLARSGTAWQVLDVRKDIAEGYEDAHIPGAIPVPACDVEQAPAAARERVLLSVPTIIVSGSGDEPDLGTCVARFASARRMAGGMAAWSAARLPEDSSSYSPPSAKAGGGCL